MHFYVAIFPRLLTFLWLQATKAAAETHTCTINQLDNLDSLYATIYCAAVKNCSAETVVSLTVPRVRGTELMKYCATMTDRASTKRAANRELEKELLKRAQKFIDNWGDLSPEQK